MLRLLGLKTILYEAYSLLLQVPFQGSFEDSILWRF